MILLGGALAASSVPGCFGPSPGIVTGHTAMWVCGGTYYIGQTNVCSFRPVAGARIIFRSTGNVVTATSDSSGAYRVELPPGAYSVRAPFAGPETRRVTVTTGKSVTENFVEFVQLP